MSIQSGFTNEVLVDKIRSTTGDEQSNYMLMLFNQNFGLIHTICKRYAAHECIEDLEQESFFGLRIAVDRYDPSEGAFITYATFWIRQCIRRYLDNSGSVLRFPVNVKNEVYRYRKMIATYKKEHGDFPSDYEIMFELKITPEHIKKIKMYSLLIDMDSLDKTIIEGDDSVTLGDAVADPADHFQEINDQIDDEILKKEIWHEVDLLGTDRADVIKRRFRDQETLQTIGDAYGVSKEHIRKIESDALRKLKRSETIQAYSDEYYSAKAYSGCGLSSFRSSGSSVTERTAIDHFIRNIERTMRRVNEKYGIEVDEGFIQSQLDKYRAAVTTM